MTTPHSFGTSFDTPFGPAFAVADGDGRALRLEIGTRDARELEAREDALGWRLVTGPPAEAPTRAMRTEVEEYFAHQRQRFSLELAPRGTAFQRSVWDLLATIPFGTTTTYGELAARLERRQAARAVGHANGQNPLWLILPCHRVIGASGALTGYAGGLAVKRALLEHEGVDVGPRGVRSSAAPAEASLFP